MLQPPNRNATRAARRYFAEILKVAVPACVHAALINAAVGVTTGFVGI